MGMTRLKRLFFGQNPRRTLIRAGLLAVVAYGVFGYAVRPARVKGISMEPTLRDGEFHVINLLVYRFREPARGDIVAIPMPGKRAFYLKRILALPGETVAFHAGTLLINGAPVDEPYLDDPGDWQSKDIVVPEHGYFVAGDNRSTEFSGHALGVVEKKQLAGTLLK